MGVGGGEGGAGGEKMEEMVVRGEMRAWMRHGMRGVFVLGGAGQPCKTVWAASS